MLALFIILVSLTMTRFSEKILISTRCIHGVMSNLIKKSWKDSNQDATLKLKSELIYNILYIPIYRYIYWRTYSSLFQFFIRLYMKWPLPKNNYSLVILFSFHFFLSEFSKFGIGPFFTCGFGTSSSSEMFSIYIY